MKFAHFKTVLLSAVALAISTSAGLATEPAKKGGSAAPLFTYKAPLRGAPATRVGGGTRSADASAMTLDVLAPDHTGYTLQESPTIYWYISERVTNPVEVTITGMGTPQEAAQPLLEIMLQPPIERGVHAVRLEDHGVALKPDTEYQWFVAVVQDPNQRSADILAGGSIKRIAAPQAIEAKLRGAGESMKPAVYAESGVWYDAIDQLSRLISTNPVDPTLRAQRAALLTSVGLQEAADHDRNAGG